MVTKIKLILLLLILSSYPFGVKCQNIENQKCEQYFEELKQKSETSILIPIFWDQAPVLENSAIPLINKICNKLHENYLEGRIMLGFILKEDGNPMCVTISIDIENTSLKNEILNLLYAVKFQPAIVNGKPVRSHAYIALNRAKCREYEILIKKNN